MRLHQELNGLTRRRRSPSQRDGNCDSPSADVSPSGAGDQSGTTFKKARLQVNDGAQAGSPSSDGEPTSDGQEDEPIARLGSRTWSMRRQRSPVIPDSAQVGWVKKSCSVASAPTNAAPLQGAVGGKPSQSEPDLGSAPLDSEQEAAAKVRKALAIYNHERLHQVVKEEERVKADGGAKRPDLKTLQIMRKRKQILHDGEKVIGHFPG